MEADMLPNPPAMLEKPERKLYALLALRELGGCTQLQLLYFMVENGIMTYFDLSLALHELVDEGLASKLPQPDESLYRITEAGLDSLSYFINRLPHSKAELIRQAAPGWKERFTAEKQFAADVTRSESGEYIARLRLLDGPAPALSVDIPMPERGLAEHLVRAWPRHAEEIYQYLMRTLSQEETP